MLVMATGGARSGKSSFAERYAAILGSEGIYIATSQAFDDEMKERIKRHQIHRENHSFSWVTIEEPYHLAELLERLDRETKTLQYQPNQLNQPSQPSQPNVILIDCLTLWLSNHLLLEEDSESGHAEIFQKINMLTETLSRMTLPVIVVTNEVGSSIVPEYVLGRRFRDLAGTMNQSIAAKCDKVFLVTAGIPVELTSKRFRFPDE